MTRTSTGLLADLFASRLQHSAEEVAHAWLHRLVGRVDSADQPTLPIKHLLDVAPTAVGWVACYIADPETDPQSVAPLLREVAELQRSRGRRASAVVRDIELLADVLLDLLRDLVREVQPRVNPLSQFGNRVGWGVVGPRNGLPCVPPFAMSWTR